MAARRICKYPFSFGTGAQTALQVELNPDDLSHACALIFHLEVTTIGTDATDTFDLKFQDTADRVNWNTRARFAQLTGNMGVNQSQRLNLQEDIAISQPEQAYWESGSSGTNNANNTEIPKGTVRNGPIVGFLRLQNGNAISKQPAWRMQFDVVDAGTQNGAWAGTVTVWADDNLM